MIVINDNISLPNRDTITFKKAFWSPGEVDLALCLDMVVDMEACTVTCDISSTIRKALFEFISYTFPSLLFNPPYKAAKDRLFKELKKIYDENYIKFHKELLPKLGFQDKLFMHQREGLFVSAHKKNVFLAFEQGMGKTITAAARSKMFNVNTTIVVCPATLKWNWFRELTNDDWGFNPLYFTILDTRKSGRMKAFQERFVIVNYEMVAKFYKYLCEIDCGHIVIDEAHRMKNTGTHTYKAIEQLTLAHPKALITFLSGTPIKNRCNDLFAYLKLTKNHLGDNHADFLRKYTYSQAGRGGERITGAKKMEDLHLRISNFMYRRTKEECLDLPEKMITKYYFQLDDFQQEYNKILMEMAENQEGNGVNSSLHSLNIVAAKSKLPGIKEIADGILEEGRKVVIFSSYKEPLNMLAEYYGSRCVKIDGSVSTGKRDAHIQRFKEDPDCTVFLGNHIAAGVGITLTNARDVIHTNFPFTSTDLDQANDRCHRIGAKNTVNIYYPICEGTIDESLFKLVAGKSKEINEIINKGKPGIVEYHNIPDELFKELLTKFKKEKV